MVSCAAVVLRFTFGLLGINFASGEREPFPALTDHHNTFRSQPLVSGPSASSAATVSSSSRAARYRVTHRGDAAFRRRGTRRDRVDGVLQATPEVGPLESSTRPRGRSTCARRRRGLAHRLCHGRDASRWADGDASPGPPSRRAPLDLYRSTGLRLNERASRRRLPCAAGLPRGRDRPKAGVVRRGQGRGARGPAQGWRSRRASGGSRCREPSAPKPAWPRLCSAVAAEL